MSPESLTLLTYTDPWPSVEWNIGPTSEEPWLPGCPSLGNPFQRIVRERFRDGRIQVTPPLHDQRTVSYGCIFEYTNRIFPIRTTSAWQSCVSKGSSNVEWYHRVEAKRLVDDPCQVFHVLYVLVTWLLAMRTHFLSDLSSKLLQHGRISCQLEDDPREGCGGCVSTCKQ